MDSFYSLYFRVQRFIFSSWTFELAVHTEGSQPSFFSRGISLLLSFSKTSCNASICRRRKKKDNYQTFYTNWDIVTSFETISKMQQLKTEWSVGTFHTSCLAKLSHQVFLLLGFQSEV